MRHTTQCVKIPAFGFADTKPHYELLDGLRGVAAQLVVFHHIFEGYAFAGSVNGVGDGIIAHLNHGYLAVDFFFLLSGFVIGYAYDDRWQRGFTLSDFFRRRLIRLHPMVVFGAVVGLVCFLLQGCAHWDGSRVSVSMAMLMFHGAIKTNIPMELEEAATIDGCSRWQTYWKVVFPLLKPTIATVAIINAMAYWNDYLLPSLVLTKKDLYTIPIATQAFYGTYSTDIGLVMAALLLAMLPILILYVFLQRYIVEGVTSGAVKG